MANFPGSKQFFLIMGGLHRKNVHVFGMIHHSANNLCPTEDFRSPGLYRKTRLLKFVHTPNICREIESHIGKDERPRMSLSRLWGVGGEGWKLILPWAFIGLRYEYFPLRKVGRLPGTLCEKGRFTFPLSLQSFNGCFTTDCVHPVDYVDCVDCVDNVSGCYFKKSLDYRRLPERLVAYS